MPETDVPSGVGRTALAIARGRAAEQLRPDRLFSDPWAAAFLDGDVGPETGPGSEFMAGYFALRTRFFDDYLRTAVAAGCRQVVLLAAGLDTRAFRLPWPADTRLFELDLPDTVRFKEKVLTTRGAEPACAREVVPVDLRDDWSAALLRQGFRPDRPTAWLAEGLLVYLTESENDALLAAVSALSAPGSHFGAEHINPDTLTLPPFQPALAAFARIGAPWRSAVADPRQWLARHGWQARITDPAELARSLDRPVPPAMDPATVDTARLWLIEATRG
ncbi:SAM-dependent methyltransferase [Amycolatopsis sp. AA4]|uniref:SAM-dependent methyltransferase n=1 Tax=Actinomycetes TaxID=1760 RepID=UPI00055E5F22|nr:MULTISPECIES: SAM-dependent methyltransferase [Actinomycetes]ATY16609.1 SAM-dependent methyltransferase [Amycolatopsis sp. AA4]